MDEGGEGGEGGEDGEDGEGDLECTCAKRYCECPWYVDMSKQEQRNHKQKLRNKRRDEKQDVTNGDNGDGRKADKCKAEKQRAAKRRRELEEEEEVVPLQAPQPGATAPNSTAASPLDQLRQAASRALFGRRGV